MLLHISVLREYIDMEFKIMAMPPGVVYDLEKAIDDFVFFWYECLL